MNCHIIDLYQFMKTNANITAFCPENNFDENKIKNAT